MASWKLAPALQVLFDEFDAIAPGRDHASDGSIGDEAHQGTDSDHNPNSSGIVCAIDVDKDLRADFSMEDVIQYFVKECRKNNPNGADEGRFNYFIYNRRIWRASGGWAQESYTGSNPHDQHAHFSCEQSATYWNNTHAWGLITKFGDGSVSIKDLQDYFGYQTGTKSTVDGCQESMIGNMAIAQRVPDVIGGGGKQVNFYKQVGQIASMVSAIQASLGALPQEVINGVLAGLAEADGAAETIANAVVAALPPDMAQEVVAEMGRLLSGDAG